MIKKICLIFLLFVGLSFNINEMKSNSYSNNNIDILTEAIILVESKGNVNAIGKNGSVGCMQIRPILVKDINRKLKRKYSLNDRYNKELSIKMFNDYMSIYVPKKMNNLSFMEEHEIKSRIWNGGPKGYKKSSTLKYWKKVKNNIIKLQPINFKKIDLLIIS